MFVKPLTLAAAIAVTLSALAPAAAEARRWDRGYGHHHHHREYRDYRGYDRGGYYGHRDRYYSRGSYGRGYRCDRGTGGTIIGAIAGGLLGHEVAQGRSGRGDGTTGAIVGAGVGALAGRAIDRNC